MRKRSIKIVNFFNRKERFYSFSRLIIDSGKFYFWYLDHIASLDTRDKIGWPSVPGTLCAKSSLAKGEKSTDYRWYPVTKTSVDARGSVRWRTIRLLSLWLRSCSCPSPFSLLLSYSHSSLTFCVSYALFVILFWSTNANELDFSSRYIYMYTGCIHNLANRKEINQCHEFGGEIL